MSLHIGEVADDIVKNRQILHYYTVNAHFVQLVKQGLHVFNFVFEYDGIHGYIYLNFPYVGVFHRFLQRFNVEVVRICTGTEFLHA